MHLLSICSCALNVNGRVELCRGAQHCVCTVCSQRHIWTMSSLSSIPHSKGFLSDEFCSLAEHEISLWCSENDRSNLIVQCYPKDSLTMSIGDQCALTWRAKQTSLMLRGENHNEAPTIRRLPKRELFKCLKYNKIFSIHQSNTTQQPA